MCGMPARSVTMRACPWGPGSVSVESVPAAAGSARSTARPSVGQTGSKESNQRGMREHLSPRACVVQPDWSRRAFSVSFRRFEEGNVNQPAALGLDLGGTALKAAWIERGGTIIEFRKQPSNTLESAHAPLEAIERAVEELRASRPALELIGVGLGAPGVIDPVTGAQVGRTAHLPHWDSFPLGADVARRLGVAVKVDNDANLAALAEARVGAAQGAHAALMITLGTGIGCGIVIEGRVMHGSMG